MSRRTDRINELLREEISELLARQIKDPRLGGVISIIEVKTSGDLRNALVLLSVMGDQEAKKNALEGIQSAASFLRKELRVRLKLRYVPFLRFALDDTLEEADQLFRVMDSIRDAQMDEVPVEERN